MNKNYYTKLNKIFQNLIIGFSIYYILSFIVTAILRLNFPFDLEWMEGGMVEHVFRLINGQDIYTAPSLQFISYIYTPVYFYLSALIANIVGMGYLPLRLVSFVSTLVAFYFIYLIVTKETKNVKLGIISVGLFAATYGVSGFWFDLARVDSLFLVLFIIAFYLLRFHDNIFSYVLAGIFASLSFLTKQTSIIFAIPIIIYLLIYKTKKSWFFIIPYVFIVAFVCYYINWQSHGWFKFWLFELPTEHLWLYRKFITFWITDLFKPLGFVAIITFVFFFIKFKNRDYKNYLIYLALIIGFILCSWISKIHLGGYDNVLMPAFASIIIVFGLGLNEIFKIYSDNHSKNIEFTKLLILIAIISQFLFLFYNPILQIPKSKDYAYRDKLIHDISKFKGDVLIPDHQYITRYAGKTSFAHSYVLIDFFNSKSELRKSLKKEYINALKNHKFSAIILDKYNSHPEIKKYYYFKKSLFGNDDYLKCKTGGHKTRPEFLFLPRKQF